MNTNGASETCCCGWGSALIKSGQMNIIRPPMEANNSTTAERGATGTATRRRATPRLGGGRPCPRRYGIGAGPSGSLHRPVAPPAVRLRSAVRPHPAIRLRQPVPVCPPGGRSSPATDASPPATCVNRQPPGGREHLGDLRREHRRRPDDVIAPDRRRRPHRRPSPPPGRRQPQVVSAPIFRHFQNILLILAQITRRPGCASSSGD